MALRAPPPPPHNAASLLLSSQYVYSFLPARLIVTTTNPSFVGKIRESVTAYSYSTMQLQVAL
jgi:hypothetical protein